MNVMKSYEYLLRERENNDAELNTLHMCQRSMTYPGIAC